MTRLSLLVFLVIFSLTPNQTFATLWTVGTGGSDYLTPNALYMADQDGEISIADYDSIYIYEQIYYGTDALAAWQQNNLYIFSLLHGSAMDAGGEYILGKGTWVCVGNNITIENIEFRDAAVPDHNGAGIRLDGIGLTLRKCYFHNNENGLLTSNPYDGDILIEYCEFQNNGYGDGFTHNMYIGHVNNFTLRYSYSHHTNVGHNVKSRANNTYILYNRIMDEEEGNSSRLIDIPNGGYALIKGNLLMQGPEALNNNAVGYGLEGLSNPVPHEFYFVHNTIINKREASCRFLQITDGTEEAYIVNNIFAGTGELIDGEATTFSHNYVNTDISTFDLIAEEVYDYRLLNSSPVIDSGMVLTGDLIPEFHYTHDYYGEVPREMVGIPDIGAYEYIFPVGLAENDNQRLLVYPNPSNGTFYIKFNEKINEPIEIQIYDLTGQLIYTETTVNNLHLINLLPIATNLVFVKVTTQNYTYNEIVLLR